MNSAVELYEALASAPDDKTRARLIAEAFERLEERYPHLPDLATQGHVRESELRVQRDIERVRAELMAEIERVRAELMAEIEHVRAELKVEIERVRAELKTDIAQLRAELKTDIAQVKADLLKWLVPLMFAQVAAIAALVKML
jgi:phage host-nuclease inhibitor protein Gam